MQIWKADLLLLLCAFIWGGTFVGIKVSLKYTTPFFLVFLRFGLSAVLFLVLFHKDIKKARIKEIGQGLLLGGLVLMGFGFQTIGLGHTTVARSAFLTETLVIFTPVLQWLILRRLPLKSTLLGIVIVFSGIGLLTSPKGSLSLNQGDWWTLLSAIAFSFFIICIDRFSKRETLPILVFYQLLGASLGSLALLLTTENISLATWPDLVNQWPPVEFFIWLGYLAFLGSGLAIFLQMRYQPLSTPARAGVIFAAEPVAASILGFVLLGEAMGIREISGAALVVAGVLVMEVGPEFKSLTVSLFSCRNNKAARRE